MRSKRVEIIEKEDKRQLTAVFGSSMSGDFLLPQLYSRKEDKKMSQYPNFNFHMGYHNDTYAENHWANENTSQQYIILPYLDQGS